MSIRAVLDTSAILAYASASIAVGELIGELTDEGSVRPAGSVFGRGCH